MRYAIADVEKATKAGLVAKWHQVNKKNTLMAVNENELLKIDADPEKAAQMLGGRLMGLEEFRTAWIDGNIETLKY